MVLPLLLLRVVAFIFQVAVVVVAVALGSVVVVVVVVVVAVVGVAVVVVVAGCCFYFPSCCRRGSIGPRLPCSRERRAKSRARMAGPNALRVHRMH